MVSGRPELVLPRLDMTALNPDMRPSQPITLDNQRWIPVINDSPALGAYLAVLVPTRLLDQQRNTMLLALALVLAGLLLIVLIKHRKLDDKVLEPLSQIVTRIRRIEAGEPITDIDTPKRGMPTELVEINRHIATMSQAIAERESKLTSTAAALATRESELSLILEHLPVPLIVFESAGEHLITFTNASFLDALGYSTTEARSLLNLFGHTCQDADTAMRVSQAIEAMISAHRNTNEPADPVEVSIQCRSGIQHDFIVSAISLQDTAIATLVDVTALRQSQRALLDAKLQAEKQEQEQSQFLAMMSHEIRTPLTSILGITELLAQDELSARGRDLVNRLENVNQLLLRIVNDVLDHSKIEAGELNLQSYRFDLHELIVKCQGMFAKLAQDKGVSLSFDVQANCPVWRQADAFRLEQVLSNLIGNAIKFTEKGTVDVNVRCLDKADDPSWIRIEVADTGIGIPKALESLIFEPYKQIENESLRQLGGTGLGLAISKRIIHAMGGQIGLNTKPQIGTTFWLELPLPLATQPDATLQRSSPSPAQTHSHLKGAHILVVDDSAAIQFLIAEMLAPLSISCHSAADGLQALTLLKDSTEGFDAVLMDIQMPNMNGIDCTCAIREDSTLKHLPIIAMTADLVGTQRQEISEAGANALLEKPLRQEQLIECLAIQIEASAWRLFPHITGIDRNHALQTMGQNADLFARLLRVFLRENADAVQCLLAQIDNGNLDGALNRLNQLQAGASQIGALKIRDIAQQIEKLLTSKAPINNALIDAIDQELTQIAQSAKRDGLLT
ncbi:MAG TPA: ATP-binding protein, partial [Orrella sp.]